MNDLFQLIKGEHETVMALLKELRARADEPVARDQREIVDMLAIMLGRHAAAEEELLYSQLAKYGIEYPDDRAQQAVREHRSAERLAADLASLPHGAPTRAPKLHALIEGLRRHIDDEERCLFASLRDAIDPEHLNLLGDLWKQHQLTALNDLAIGLRRSRHPVRTSAETDDDGRMAARYGAPAIRPTDHP
jgi:hemerythrin-like domain-containing protein